MTMHIISTIGTKPFFSTGLKLNTIPDMKANIPKSITQYLPWVRPKSPILRNELTVWKITIGRRTFGNIFLNTSAKRFSSLLARIYRSMTTTIYATSIGSKRASSQKLPLIFMTMYRRSIRVKIIERGMTMYDIRSSRYFGQNVAFDTSSSIASTSLFCLIISIFPGYRGVNDRKYIVAKSTKTIFAVCGQILLFTSNSSWSVAPYTMESPAKSTPEKK